MIPRTAHQTLLRLAQSFPALALTGPRQSGKTTLAKAAFPGKPHVNLEDPDIRLLAEEDPRGLLARFPEGAILDEIQRAPALLSYLQTIIDTTQRPGMFILTGSQQFGLHSGITQSLADRVAMVTLLPFSMSELQAVQRLPANLDELLFRGFYPPVYDRDIAPLDWSAAYVSTYLERDVRQLIAIRDLSTFQRFLRFCAGRTGQLLNLASLAADCGIAQATATAWLAVLEAGYIIFLLRPYFRNFNKRLVKAPKLYFHDPGLAAWLLGIREPAQLGFHAQRGALFENLVIAEFMKARVHRGMPPDMFFWRDNHGLEIDLLLEEGTALQPVEIKSGQTVNPDYFTALKKWMPLAGNQAREAWMVYGGDQALRHHEIAVFPWWQLPRVTSGG